MSLLKRIFLTTFLVCLQALVAAPLCAQTSAPVYNLSGLKWRNVGPNRGGRSLAVAGSAKRPLEYYFGATGGGVWKTTDGGITWRPVTDGQIKSSSVGALAISESNPDVVYVGMGESELRGNVMQGDGVYKTSDGGKTWSHMGLDNTQAIAHIRIHPTNPDLVYVAALGHPFGKNPDRGVFRSKDGGKTWDKILFRNDGSGAIDLSLDPHNPQVLFASIWEVYRRPWTLSSGGPGCGLFKSVDGGDTWTEITRNPGLPKGLVGKINVSVSGADSKRVYVNIEADDGGLFRSDDAGATWTNVSVDRNIRQRAFYFNRIVADTKDPDTVYAMNVQFYKSTDGGKKLNQMRTPHSDHHDLWIAPDNPNRMIVAEDGGGAVTINGGRTWTQHAYPTAQLYHVATTRDIPYHICGAQQDDGTVCVPSDGGQNLRGTEGSAAYSVGGGEAGYLTPHPKNPNIFYAGDQAGALTRFDRATGQVHNVHVYPLFFSGMAAKDLVERWQWVFPIVFSPFDSNILYASSQHLWKTTDEGQSWKQISPDLTRADPDTLGDSGGPITHDQNGPEIYGTIFTVAPSHHDAKTIWAGSDDGLVHITRDGGAHWDKVTPPELPKFSRLSLIEASPNKPATAYLAAHRYEMDDRKPYIFRTDDYGKTWTKIVGGLAEGDFVRAVREDPKRPGLLYAGTEHGVYVSFDNGSRWQSLALNMPDTQIPDLVVEGDDVVVATHGRGFYVLDNVASLRQLTSDVSGSPAFLFKPAAAVRSLYPATIDYFLKEDGGKVGITILDPAGKVVQTFGAAAADANPQQQGAAPESKAGINRFVWDLRYPGATVFKGMILRASNPARGPFAAPGRYQVQLTVNGKTQSQPLVVTRDARLTNVTDADLAAQFKLAMEVVDKTSQTNDTVIRIRDIKKQITDRMAKAGDPAISAAGKALDAKISAVEGELYQVRNQSPRDTLNYPIKLNDQFAFLLAVINAGDAHPTEQSYAVFKVLSANLAALSAQLDAALKNDLAPLNTLLQGKNLEPIPVR